jgi:hypothetical protein
MILLHHGVIARAQNHVKYTDIKPGMHDRWLEREGVRLANKRGMEYHWHERYTKAIILSNDWELYYDHFGCLHGRCIRMELLAEMPNGQCAMADFTFKQPLRNDDTPSDLSYDTMGDFIYIDCD